MKKVFLTAAAILSTTIACADQSPPTLDTAIKVSPSPTVQKPAEPIQAKPSPPAPIKAEPQPPKEKPVGEESAEAGQQ